MGTSNYFRKDKADRAATIELPKPLLILPIKGKHAIAHKLTYKLETKRQNQNNND